MRLKNKVSEISNYKCNMNKTNIAMFGILAGMFIAIGGACYLASLSRLDNIFLGKMLASALFPVGLILTVFLNGELFTGNVVTLVELGKGRSSKILTSIIYVYVFNILGSIFMAWLIYKSSVFDSVAVNTLTAIVESKCVSSTSVLFYKGILCNIFVCGSILATCRLENSMSKTTIIWFIITLFVILGLEHCVANMFYVSAYVMYKSISLTNIVKIIGIPTLGNILGGLIITYMSCENGN